MDPTHSASPDDPATGAWSPTRLAHEAPPAGGGVLLMGIVNVTPDSFSDGGRYLDPARAIEHGRRLHDEGAWLLDVGGESTRPGARPVGEAEELERVLPVVEGLAAACPGAAISIDTTKAGVARAALDAGAAWINDVSAGECDAAMLPLAAERRAPIVLMHRRGRPADMQAAPRYENPVAEVRAYLAERVERCLEAGIEPQRIVLDPGIGFGKRLDHNLELLRRLPELRPGAFPLLIGVSRKSFIGHLCGAEGQEDWRAREAAPRTRAEHDRARAADRLGGTAAAVTVCLQGGAEVLRVHDVAVMAEAARVACALAGRPAPLVPPAAGPALGC